MRRQITALAFAVALGPSALAAQPVATTEAYDLLFRNGTLDALPENAELTYDRTVENALDPEAGPRDTGLVALDITASDAGPDVAELQFRQGERFRSMGSFPASVGNPMIMVFYETTIRDMAAASGGSPFYIRNRIKDALVAPNEITEGTAAFGGEDVPVKSVTLRPFAGDPNADRMQGFADLEMTVTMSDAVPGWYLTLEAEAPGDGAPTYLSRYDFAGVEEAE